MDDQNIQMARRATAELQGLLAKELPALQRGVMGGIADGHIAVDQFESQPGNLLYALTRLWGTVVQFIPEAAMESISPLLDLACFGLLHARLRSSFVGICSLLGTATRTQHPKIREHVAQRLTKLVPALLHTCMSEMADIGVTGQVVDVLVELQMRVPEQTGELVLHTLKEGRWLESKVHAGNAMLHFKQAYKRILDELARVRKQHFAQGQSPQPRSRPASPNNGARKSPKKRSALEPGTRELFRIQNRLDSLFKDVRKIKDGVEGPDVLLGYVM